MYIFKKEDLKKNKKFFYEFEKLVEEALQNYPTFFFISNSNPPSHEIFSENGEILYKKSYYNAYVEYAGKVVEYLFDNLPPEIKNLYQED